MHEFVRPATAHPQFGPTYWNAAIVPVRNGEGEVEGVVMSATQITDQITTRERLLAAERTRTHMAESVAAETNHRMKNNLSLISGLLQLQLHHEPAGSPAAARARDAVGRICALAAVHEQLYTEQPGRVELSATLRRVAETNVRSLSGAEVALSFEGPEMHVSPRAGSVLAVMANEMITNALKHGGPAADGKRHLHFSLSLRGDRLLLALWNSGRPLPADFDAQGQPGLGLRLLYDLASSQLGGELSLRPEGQGTCCEIAPAGRGARTLRPRPARHGWQI